jgi:PAS domain S-box-containing protein
MADQTFKHSDIDSAIVQWLNDYAQRGILITDASFAIRGWNRWLEQNTCYTAEAVSGKCLFDVFPEIVERRLDQAYQEALSGKVTLLAHRFHRYLLKLGARPEYGLAEMQQSVLISPLVRDGQIVGTITAIEDVSERVARENQLIAEREAADHANEAKDRFLSVLSHDLRTPLTAILGWARVFQSRPTDEGTVRKGAAVIERNVGVQLELIEEILDISRISAAKLELNITPVNVRAATVMTLEMLEPIAEAKGVRLHSVMPEQEREADLDSKRFQQILWNLVSNAVKFTPDGGSVHITLTYRDCDFQLTIADTGKGIDAENLGHVFDPLWQAEASGRQGGLGLGLTIVKNLVELHGGSIRAESSGLGHGAVFHVEIPWSRLQASIPAQAIPAVVKTGETL